MRESPNYRITLERLDDTYKGELLTEKEVAEFLGCSINSVRKFIPRTRLGISKTAVADFLSKVERV